MTTANSIIKTVFNGHDVLMKLLSHAENQMVQPQPLEIGTSQRKIRDKDVSRETEVRVAGNNNTVQVQQSETSVDGDNLVEQRGQILVQPLDGRQNTSNQPIIIEEPIVIDDQDDSYIDDESQSVIFID